MTIRYLVDIAAFGTATRPCQDRPRIVRNLSLHAAWKIAERAARRGVALYGGRVVRCPWGMRGGEFPARYRSAVIKMDTGAKRHWGRA